MAKDGAIEPVGEDWETLFPGEYLRGVDLHGGKPTVRITKIYIKTIRKKKHPIIEMAGKERKWRVNFTNGLCLMMMFGKDPRGWVGHEVTLCAEMVNAFGRGPQPAIRVHGSPELKDPIEVYKDLGEHVIKRTLRPTKRNGGPPTSRSK